MLKVEIFKQETAVLLAATKLWLFYKKCLFLFLHHYQNNVTLMDILLLFGLYWWVYSPWITAVREGSVGLASILLLPISGSQHLWLGRMLSRFCRLHYVQTSLAAGNKSLLLF